MNKFSNYLSVVIPVYGDGLSLPKLCEQLSSVLLSLVEKFEIILVNDGSPDEVWEIIQTLARENAYIVGINLSRNFGQHNALLCGIRSAKGDVIVTMDDDLQHDPEELPKLLAKLDEGNDVVYGPPINQQHGLFRDFASYATKYVLEGLIGTANARQVSALRAFRTKLREGFVGYRNPTVNIDVLLSWTTSRFEAVRVRHNPREIGESTYTSRKLVGHALNMMTGFSSRPLQMAGIMGFAFSLFGMGVLAYVLLCWLLWGSSVPGFAFLASIISIFSGAQLLALGVIGEYLARIHFRTIERPSYTVREKTSGAISP